METDLDILTERVARRLEVADGAIEGPIAIEYGFGWDPSHTLWKLDRRVHVYWGGGLLDGRGVTVEFSTAGGEAGAVAGFVGSEGALVDVIHRFLGSRCSVDALGIELSAAPYQWISIPHPPARADLAVGNVAAAFSDE